MEQRAGEPQPGMGIPATTPSAPARPGLVHRLGRRLQRSVARGLVQGVLATTLLGAGSLAQAANFNWSTPTCLTPASGGRPACTSVGDVTRFANAVSVGGQTRDILMTIVAFTNNAQVMTTANLGRANGAAIAGTAGAYFTGAVDVGDATGATANATSEVTFRLTFVTPGTTTPNPLPYPVEVTSIDTDGDGTTAAGVRERVEFFGSPIIRRVGSQLQPATMIASGSYAFHTCVTDGVTPCLADGTTGSFASFAGLSDTTTSVNATAVYDVGASAGISELLVSFGTEVSPGGTSNAAFNNRLYGLTAGIPDTNTTSVISCSAASVQAGTPVSCTATCTNQGPLEAIHPICRFTSTLPAGATQRSDCSTPPAAGYTLSGATTSCTIDFTPGTAGSIALAAGSGAENDVNGGLDPTAGDNPSAFTLTVSANANMRVALANLPATVRPGQAVSGVTTTCTNTSATAAALNPSCVPSVTALAGGVSTPLSVTGLACTPALGASLAANGSTVCTFGFTVPGTQGGADEPNTTVRVDASTSASNDSDPTDNSATASTTLLDTLDDTTSLPGGLTGQSFNLATNDQVTAGAVFSLRAGSTCANPSVSSAGVAGFDVPSPLPPGTTCTVNYQACDASLTSTCDTAVLTVTPLAADMAVVITGVPATVRPGQTVNAQAVCTNRSASVAASQPSCVPSVSRLIGGSATPLALSGLVCNPALGASLAPNGSSTCSFSFTVPGTQGGDDETTTQIRVDASTGASNDSDPTNNSATASGSVIDTLDDSTSLPGGLTGQSFNLAGNDQVTSGAAFALRAGSTCPSPSVSSVGVATFDVPGSGNCTVHYQACDASLTTTCDTAVLTVTAQGADMAVSLAGLPPAVGPGQAVSGLSATCRNLGSGPAVLPRCVPAVNAISPAGSTPVTLTGLSCTPALGSTLAAGASTVCSFGFVAPGSTGGTDETTTSLAFGASTGAANDTNPANDNASGSAPFIDALDDGTVNLGPQGGRITVLANDTLGSSSFATLGAAATSLSLADAAGLSGLSVDAATGQLVLAAGAPSGSYTVTYRLCAATAASACDTARVTLQIQAADMQAQIVGLPSHASPAVPLAGTLVCHNNGPVAASQVGCALSSPPAGVTLGACTLAGAPVTLPLASLANGAELRCPISFTTPANGLVTINGQTSALNDNLPGNNSASAQVAIVDAVDDGSTTFLRSVGGRVPLLPNDSIGGAAVLPAQAAVSLLDLGGLATATLDAATAAVVVPAGSTPGSYTLRYQLCSIAPATVACDSANAIVVINGEPDLTVSKSHSPSVFTEGRRGRYTISARNVGSAPTVGGYTLVDTLPAGLTVAAVPVATGWDCSASRAGSSSLSCSCSVVLAAGAAAADIALDVDVAIGACRTPDASGVCSGAAALVNTVVVSGGGQPPTATGNDRFDDPTPVQQAGAVSGLVWFDLDHDRVFGGADRPLASIVVEIVDASGALAGSATTDASGNYRVEGLAPGSGYSVRFRDSGSGAYYGKPVSNDPTGGNDPSAAPGTGLVAGSVIQGITVPAGSRARINQSLPLDPNGVVYASDNRQPVAGAVVELRDAGGTLVPANCVVGGSNRITTSLAGAVPGGYNFLLLNPPPAGCPGAATYQLALTPPAGFAASTALPAPTRALSTASDCVNGAGLATCEVQAQASAPTGAQPTPYFLSLPLDPAAGPAIVNNHIPLDPTGSAALVLVKTADHQRVELGDSVRYTLTLRRGDSSRAASGDITITDTLPLGFVYIAGTARLRVGATGPEVAMADPAGAPGPTLRFAVGALKAGESVQVFYRVRVGVGAERGSGVNRAQACTAAGNCSIPGTHRVRIDLGVFSSDACVVGKVYVDCNHNQVQDAEELGIPGVRLYFQDGSSHVTDVEGKYSACGLLPRTHVLSVDASTLPRGSRLVVSSNRNAGDAGSLFVDLKSGELHRADFIEGSCSNRVLEQVKARRARGEVSGLETEKQGGRVLTFDGKPVQQPARATDSARQQGTAGGCGEPGIVKPRTPGGQTAPAGTRTTAAPEGLRPLAAGAPGDPPTGAPPDRGCAAPAAVPASSAPAQGGQR